MWLEQMLVRGCERAADQVCLRDSRRDVTWHDLDRDARALAVAVGNYAHQGDRVVILSGNRVEMIEAYFACALAGTIAAPINPALTEPEMRYLIDATSPVLCVADAAGLERLGHSGLKVPALAMDTVPDLELPPGTAFERAPVTELVMLLHTSATTGRPKGVMVDHRYLQFQALSWIAETLPAPNTIYLSAAPLSHGSVTVALDYLAAGGVVAIMEQFTPRGFFRAVEKWNARHVLLIPSMLALILQDKRASSLAKSSLTAMILAGAPTPHSLMQRAREVCGVPLHTVFGITEAGGMALHRWPDERLAPAADGAACAGRAMPGFSVRVRAENGDPVPTGQPGLIHLACDGLMPGYWANPAATSEAIVDGWLNTGDIGYLDDGGFVWILDRRTDMILRGGQNVYPAELEQVLRTSPHVKEAVVVAAPSELWGQTPVAFIEPADGGTIDLHELIDLCVSQLASYKRPSRFIIIEQIPRNPLGKILRQELRRRVTQPPPPGADQGS